MFPFSLKKNLSQSHEGISKPPGTSYAMLCPLLNPKRKAGVTWKKQEFFTSLEPSASKVFGYVGALHDPFSNRATEKTCPDSKSNREDPCFIVDPYCHE